ncbi:hypothetical protein DPEC_G00378560 [Dallia pectoralis]|nr:hypothetical protein DPEC_G00378560 [Dallia pectoralis]
MAVYPQMPVVNIQPGVFQSPDQKTPWSSGICDCCEDIQIFICSSRARSASSAIRSSA